MPPDHEICSREHLLIDPTTQMGRDIDSNFSYRIDSFSWRRHPGGEGPTDST
ncbi:MAG: hypothetical protein M1121_03495 [Actinobacteria bacterium]|nr:hypothetical protein [Actinomycetota bacterium]